MISRGRKDPALPRPRQSFSSSNPPTLRAPSPLSPAPPRPQQHCLACREGKQFFLMNHPTAFLIAFTSWAPNSQLDAPIPSSTYFPLLRAQTPFSPVVLLHRARSGLPPVLTTPRSILPSYPECVHLHPPSRVGSLLSQGAEEAPSLPSPSLWSIPNLRLSRGLPKPRTGCDTK